MRPAGWNGTRAHPDRHGAEIYPGVAVRENVHPHLFRRRNGPAEWIAPCIRFEGSEEALRRAGLLRAGDRLPQRPGGCSGFATMSRGGRIRVRLHREEAAARDRAFVRFMEAVIVGLRPGRRRGAEDEDDDDWPVT